MRHQPTKCYLWNADWAQRHRVTRRLAEPAHCLQRPRMQPLWCSWAPRVSRRAAARVRQRPRARPRRVAAAETRRWPPLRRWSRRLACRAFPVCQLAVGGHRARTRLPVAKAVRSSRRRPSNTARRAQFRFSSGSRRANNIVPVLFLWVFYVRSVLVEHAAVVVLVHAAVANHLFLGMCCYCFKRINTFSLNTIHLPPFPLHLLKETCRLCISLSRATIIALCFWSIYACMLFCMHQCIAILCYT